MSTVVHLDAGEYTAVWRTRGEKPTVLHTPDHGDTHAARDALDDAAWTRLVRRGLARGRTPEPALADVLEVLAAPDAEVDVRLWSGGPPTAIRRVLAAARGGLGVVAEVDDDGGLRAEAGAAQPAATLLGRLPDEPALSGTPMTLPAAAMGAGDEAARVRRLRRAGVPRPTVLRLDALWSAPPRRVLQFGVARRGPDGRRRRGPRVLDVVDAAGGRIALLHDDSGRHLTVRPAGSVWLRGELSARLEALGGPDRGVP